MPKVEVFDPPMCCATGVCGPEVDPTLARFGGDLGRLSRAGVLVTRYNLAQDPRAFMENATVLQTLREQGSDVLPMVLVDGGVVSTGRYPSFIELAGWTGVNGDGSGDPENLLPSGSS